LEFHAAVNEFQARSRNKTINSATILDELPQHEDIHISEAEMENVTISFVNKTCHYQSEEINSLFVVYIWYNFVFIYLIPILVS